jgi:sugar/nucleoside kinase (ribokinase family)
MTKQEHDQKFFDLICIGSLNTDLICSNSRRYSIQGSSIEFITSKFEYGTENKISDTEIDSILSLVPIDQFEVSYGGSAFNTLHAAVTANPKIKSAYLGVAGNSMIDGFDFQRKLQELEVDTSYVKCVPEKKTGMCISLVNEGERTLLTNPGVNINIKDFLLDNFKNITMFLSRSRFIHLTSFFVDDISKILFDLLSIVKRINPLITISFDPGHYWIVNMNKHIESLISISDILFLNDREFQILSHRRKDDDDLLSATKIFNQYRLPESSLLILLKRYNEIKTFFKIQESIVMSKIHNDYLPTEKIEDSTGAGDVFAAGFLLGSMLPWININARVKLGLDLVKLKLAAIGSESFLKNRSVYQNFLNSLN